MPKLIVNTADLRGAARLATEATTGLADLVEAMHERIARLPGVANRGEPGKTTGITGLVYRSVRGVTRLVGGSVDGLLALLSPMLDQGAAGTQREAIVAALNGVLGDHLAATKNPLATPMRLRHGGVPLVLQRQALQERLPPGNGRLLVLVHGLCMNDLQWQRDGHDHGQALADAEGYTPVYLHYNSGLPIAANGLELAQLLHQLLAAWPQPLQRLVLMGHSMGGLVARSALHQAAAAGDSWPQQVSGLVCLGTPHHGAPLERAGRGIDLVLDATPYAAPLARLGKMRSAGITDLRHGRVVADDATGGQVHVPLPGHMSCYAVAGTLGEQPGEMKGKLLGDGLVPVASALGQHKTQARTLHFAPAHQWVAQGVNHMQLLSDPGVCAQLARWLR